MSQFFKNVQGVVPPGTGIVTVTGDDAVIVPPNAAGNLNLFGGSSTINNTNGITTVGNAGTNTETFTLTNRYQQNTTTIGAVTSNVTILGALVAGTYVFDMSVAAFATSGGASGNGYTIVGAVRSDGAIATLLPNQQKDSFEENVGANAVLGVSANTVIVTVTGIALFNFDWNVTGTYMVVT